MLRRELPAQPEPQRLAYMGHVQKKSGIQMLLAVMPALIQQFPQVRLDVIGGGPYLSELQRQACESGLDERVTFHGFIDDHTDLEKILMQCGVGVALYDPASADFSYLADPGKPKVYLACGLPVVITDVPEIAKEIEERGAGSVVGYNAEEIQKALSAILTGHEGYRRAALALAEEYEWETVFRKAFRG